MIKIPRWLLVGALCVSLSSQAKETPADYAKRARALQKAGDYEGALKYFSVARKLTHSSDPSLLIEYGYAAYLAKSYKAAEGALREAITEAAGDKALLSKAYYTLGLVLEATGDPAAKDAYADSLVVKQNKAALLRLAALKPYAPTSMSGPFNSLQEWCNEQRLAAPKLDCRIDSAELSAELGIAAATGSGPYQELQVVGLYGEFEAGLRVAVKLKAGWFVSVADFPAWRTAEEYFDTYHHQMMIYDTSNEVKLNKLEVSDLIPGGDPEVVLSFTHSYGIKEGPGIAYYDTAVEATLLVGLGPSGVPSAIAPVVTKVSGGINKSKKDSASYSMRVDTAGALVVKQTKKSGKPLQFPETQAGVGVWALVFP